MDELLGHLPSPGWGWASSLDPDLSFEAAAFLLLDIHHQGNLLDPFQVVEASLNPYLVEEAYPDPYQVEEDPFRVVEAFQNPYQVVEDPYQVVEAYQNPYQVVEAFLDPCQVGVASLNPY